MPEVIYPGLAMGVAWSPPLQESGVKARPFQGRDEELALLQGSLDRSEQEITALADRAREHLGQTEAEIFEAHLMMLQDPEFLDAVRQGISDGLSADTALTKTIESFAELLSASDSEYLRARVADLRDVGQRLRRNLVDGISHRPPSSPFIVVAEDLAPSDLMAITGPLLQGVVLESGGPTSHTAILLRSLEIPSLFQVGDVADSLSTTGENPATICLDATATQVSVNPGDSERAEFAQRLEQNRQRREALIPWRRRPTVLTDGTRIQLLANVGNQKQLEKALDDGAEGVGLYRTEFLFMDRSRPPGLDEQIKIYRQAIETLEGRPLVIRTLDVGGDKRIPYLNLPLEPNPFLGVRGLRLSLRHPEIFTTQIKALWAAADLGPIDIMFPMVTTLAEIDAAFDLIRKTIDPEAKTSVPRKPGLRWGMMLEIPSNIFMIPEFSEKLDFFSVGSNDLTQYLTACDRENPALGSLGDASHPALHRALRSICGDVQRAGRELSLCGEMASNPVWAATLVGHGFRKLSLNSGLITEVRAHLAESSLEKLQSISSDWSL